MFHLQTNSKIFFKIEDKPKFYHHSLSELQTLCHLQAMLKTSKVLKKIPAVGQNTFKKQCTLTCANSK